MTRECKSCGGTFDEARRLRRLADDGITPFGGELQYCRCCADELFRDIIRIQNVNTYASGAGCPLEPNDDAGPWGENAIRELERDGESC